MFDSVIQDDFEVVVAPLKVAIWEKLTQLPKKELGKLYVPQEETDQATVVTKTDAIHKIQSDLEIKFQQIQRKLLSIVPEFPEKTDNHLADID